MFGSFTKQAGASLAPSIFVKLGTDNLLVACGSGDAMWGITPYYVRNVAIADYSAPSTQTYGSATLYCAIAGEGVACIGPGDDEALLQLGGTVSIGNYLKSDGSGFGVAASVDKDHVNAQALQSGVSGDLIRVKPMRFDLAV